MRWVCDRCPRVSLLHTYHLVSFVLFFSFFFSSFEREEGEGKGWETYDGDSSRNRSATGILDSALDSQLMHQFHVSSKSKIKIK